MHTDIVIDPTDISASIALDAARAAEDAGFDGVWSYDHFSGASLGGSSAHDAWTLLGAVAGVTSRVMVGPLVANVSVRHPATLAVAAATLQQLSDGRAMLGIGAGAGPESAFSLEMEMVGLVPRAAPARRTMVVEAMAAVRQLWRGGGTRTGDFFGLDAATGFPSPDPEPPIFVGANGPKLTEAAARAADGVVFHSFGAELERLVDVARSAAVGRALALAVHAPLADEWLLDDHDSRGRLIRLGVDRLILAWRGDDGVVSVTRAGGLLAS